MRRVLTFPVTPKASLPRPDPDLAGLASALLDTQAMRGHYFSSDLFADPAWAMVLFVYASQGRRAGLSLDSLRDSQLVGPATVTLRWILKLVDEGVFQLVGDGPQPGNTFVQTSSDALKNLEKWLRLFQARIA